MDAYVYNGKSLNRVGGYSSNDHVWLHEAAKRNPDHIYFYATDPAWEKVSASVQDYVWPYSDDEVVPETPVVEFLIEVINGGRVWFRRILVSEEDLNEFPELYGETLNEMIKQIDMCLEEGY